MARPVEPTRCDDGAPWGSGADVYHELLARLRGARQLLPSLPTDRRQNYLLHDGIDKLVQLIDAIEGTVCYAPAPPVCIEDTPASRCPRCEVYGLTDDDQTCHECGYPSAMKE